MGLVLALKKGKWSKSAELVWFWLRLREFSGLLLPWIGFSKHFLVPNPLVVSHCSCCGFPARNSSPIPAPEPGSWVILRPFPTGAPTASSVQSFSLKLANIQNIKHNIYTGTVTRGVPTPSVVPCGDKRNAYMT